MFMQDSAPAYNPITSYRQFICFYEELKKTVNNKDLWIKVFNRFASILFN